MKKNNKILGTLKLFGFARKYDNHIYIIATSIYLMENEYGATFKRLKSCAPQNLIQM